MKMSEVSKGTWIINAKEYEKGPTRPWYVCCKIGGEFVGVRRGPKRGPLVGITRHQLKNFKRFCENCGEPV